MKIIIAGGGTGGHLYPGIALAKGIQERFPGSIVQFVGTQKGIESKIVPNEGFPLKTIRVEGWVGRSFLNRLKALLKIPQSLIQSFRILRAFDPDLVIGVGGYASGPLLLSAILTRRKTVILEQNVIPGLTNHFLGNWVCQIFGSFEGSRPYFPASRFCFSGNPVRKEILSLSSRPDREPATVLVFGGSQGAHAINAAVVDALDILRRDGAREIRWIHQTGAADAEWVRAEYRKRNIQAEVEPFIFDMARAYAESDLTVCRAGATTLAELSAFGMPAILIPYPRAAHRHQEKNALHLKGAGAAEVINPDQATGPVLADRIRELLESKEKRARMSAAMASLGRRDATEQIIDRCLSLGLIHV